MCQKVHVRLFRDTNFILIIQLPLPDTKVLAPLMAFHTCVLLQVRYTFTKGSPVLLMPPPFSIVIQVAYILPCTLYLCLHIFIEFWFLFQESEKGSWHVPISNGNNEVTAITWLCITRPICYQDLGAESGVKTVAVTGKRKERSPSPLHQHSSES